MDGSEAPILTVGKLFLYLKELMYKTGLKEKEGKENRLYEMCKLRAKIKNYAP